MEAISVSALNRYVKDLLDGNELLNDLCVSAELASFHLHRKSGHCYFILKDAQSSVKAVMFSRDADRLSFVPEDGMQLLVRAQATVYQKDGTFQLYVTHMFLDGVGALNAAFLQTKQRLEQQGLFLPEHKKPLPVSPSCIGLVTSKDGAALQDILAVVKRRALKDIKFVLYDVPVQGATAAEPIAHAIKALDELDEIELLVVSRGGGSAEDLFVFNSEVIAQAIFDAKKPVVSAIGHEIDTLISDLVADMRAATPTAAAEMILPDPSELLYRYRAAVASISVERISETIRLSREKVVLLSRSISDSLQNAVSEQRRHLDQISDKLSAFNPENVLKKGYAVLRRDGAVLGMGSDIPIKGEHISIETSAVLIDCKVEQVATKD